MEKKESKAIIAIVLCSIVLLALATAILFQKKEAQESTKIRVGDLPVLQGLPFYLAIEKGYFKEAGLEVERVRFDAPNQIVDALMQNKIDVGSTTVALGIIGVANSKNPGKIKIYAVSGGTKQIPNENLLIPVDSNLTTIAELKGKKIGILSGTIQWRTITRHILAVNGMDMDKDVTIVELAPSLQVPALASHQVDALLALEPMSTLAIEQKVGKIVVQGPAEQFISDPFYPGAGAISTSFAKKNPKTTKKFLQVMQRAIKEANDNPDAAKQYLKGYTPLTDELITKVPNLIVKTCDSLSAADKESIQSFYDIFTKYKVVESKIDFAKISYCEQ